MKILDTTFLIDLTRGSPNSLKVLKKDEILLTTQINMYELIKGFYLKNASSKKILEIRELFENIRVLPLDDNSIIKSANIYAELSRNGVEISNSDCLIAGIALSNNVTTIITRNKKHFERIKGIKVETY